MASVSNDSDGNRRFQFVDVKNKRHTLRFGKVDRKEAEDIRRRIERLASAAKMKTAIDDETAQWAATLPDKVHQRLAKAKLVRPRKHLAQTLGTLIDKYMKLAVIKPSTAVSYQVHGKCMKEYFKADTDVADIDAIAADEWRNHMSKHLAQATIARRVKFARQLFRRAERWKMITENPFVGVIAGEQTNKARMHFVTEADAEKVLDACPSSQWRVLFALSRYGGLRCPSEHMLLKWADVNFEHGRILVTSPKTEKFPDGDTRLIPLFPELEKYLLEAHGEAEPGTVHVITRRDSTVNLRTQLQRIIKRAGLKPWPRLFHNLRGSRQTELSDRFPAHVVCDWIGNSEIVAKDHYLHTIDAHMTAALTKQIPKVAHNPAQHISDSAGTDRKPTRQETQKTPVLPGLSGVCRTVPAELVTPAGFEPASRP